MERLPLGMTILGCHDEPRTARASGRQGSVVAVTCAHIPTTGGAQQRLSVQLPLESRASHSRIPSSALDGRRGRLQTPEIDRTGTARQLAATIDVLDVDASPRRHSRLAAGDSGGSWEISPSSAMNFPSRHRRDDAEPDGLTIAVSGGGSGIHAFWRNS